VIEETGSELFQIFQIFSSPCRLPLVSPFPMSHNHQPFSGGFASTPAERYPAAPEGRPGGGITALHEDFELENSAEDCTYENQNTNNTHKGIVNGLPWLSYAGGLGGGSPPVLIPLILCLFREKPKKSALFKSSDRNCS
jgi:hypothetical protein